MVLCSLPLLSDTLEYLVWGLTQELTRVTDLFIDQCEARKGAQGSAKLNAFPGECIPIVKPVLVRIIFRPLVLMLMYCCPVFNLLMYLLS